MITDKNNLHDVDTWMIFKWVFKSAAAILIVSNTWNIVMGVFDAAQSVVTQAAGIIGSDASIDISSVTVSYTHLDVYKRQEIEKGRSARAYGRYQNVFLTDEELACLLYTSSIKCA